MFFFSNNNKAYLSRSVKSGALGLVVVCCFHGVSCTSTNLPTDILEGYARPARRTFNSDKEYRIPTRSGYATPADQAFNPDQEPAGRDQEYSCGSATSAGRTYHPDKQPEQCRLSLCVPVSTLPFCGSTEAHAYTLKSVTAFCIKNLFFFH